MIVIVGNFNGAFLSRGILYNKNVPLKYKGTYILWNVC